MRWQRISHCALLSKVAVCSSTVARPAEAVREIAPRQTDNILSELIDVVNAFGLSACIPKALPLATELPKVPEGLLNDDLVSQALSQTTLALSDICKFSITGTDGPRFTSFLPTLYSWYGDHSSQIGSIVSDCPSASPLVQTIEAYGGCSQVSAWPASAAASQTDSDTFSIQTDTVINTPGSTGTGTTTATSGTTRTTETNSAGSTLTSTSATQSPSSSVSQALAPCGTAVVGTAMGIAGFMGIIMAL